MHSTFQSGTGRRRETVALAALAGALLLTVLAGWKARADAVPGDPTRKPVALGAGWRFQAGDDLAWASPSFDAGAWPSIRVPEAWGRQGFREASWGWYRLSLELGTEAGARREDLRLALWLSRVESSYEVYAGGERLGGRGSLPPRARMEYDHTTSYPIPARAISPDGRLVLALRVYRDPAFAPGGGGIIDRAPRLGRVETLAVEPYLAGLPALLLAAAFAAGAAYYLLLFHAWRSPVYAAFAALLLNQAAFIFLTGPFRFLVTSDYIALKEAEYLARFALPATVMQFIWAHLGKRMARPLRAYQLSHLGLAAVVVAEPGLRWNLAVVHLWELWVVPLIFGASGWVISRAWRGDRRARVIALGAAALALTFAWDIARGRGLVEGPALSPLGLLLLGMAMAASVADRLRSTHLELEAMRADLERRVAERTEELEQARRVAETANQAKSDFLANMSHEIRTPMAGVSGLAELLAKAPLEPTERRYVEAIQTSAATLERVVGEILDFSQIEAGRLEIRRSSFSPRELVEAVATLFRPLAARRGLVLEVSLDPELPAAAVSDPARLRQVLVNLVGNAIKFTERGAVRLEAAAPSPERLRFAVVDTGLGIDEETGRRLFQPFSQGSTGADRRFGGTGLGLAISRRLVVALGGEIGFESQPGAGSRFWFEVPGRGAVDSPAEPLAPAPAALAVSAASPAASEMAAGRDPAATSQVLVAEDDPVSSFVVTQMLTSLGYQVRAVGDGESALAALAVERFDLVLIDCQMPGLDGYETTRRLREQEAGARHTPVVALTAHAMRGDRERCLAAGMDDYLAKPVSQEALARTVERWVGADLRSPADRSG